MIARWLIIDGNNLVHAIPDLAVTAGRDFQVAREKLIHRLDELTRTLADRVTVVFDGTQGGRPSGFVASEVEVLFPPAGLTADSVIERLATQARDRDAITVVSSDLLERHTVEAGGVHTMSCRSFIEALDAERTRLTRQLGAHRSPRTKNALGEFFP